MTLSPFDAYVAVIPGDNPSGSIIFWFGPDEAQTKQAELVASTHATELSSALEPGYRALTLHDAIQAYGAKHDQ